MGDPLCPSALITPLYIEVRTPCLILQDSKFPLADMRFSLAEHFNVTIIVFRSASPKHDDHSSVARA